MQDASGQVIDVIIIVLLNIFVDIVNIESGLVVHPNEFRTTARRSHLPKVVVSKKVEELLFSVFPSFVFLRHSRALHLLPMHAFALTVVVRRIQFIYRISPYSHIAILPYSRLCRVVGKFTW